jgi:hypothetical protein
MELASGIHLEVLREDDERSGVRRWETYRR